MATYTIIPLSDGTSYNVVVTSDSGAYHMHSFETEAEAEEWIAYDKEPRGPVEDC